jgi:NAD(P)H-hydrate epimerase
MTPKDISVAEVNAVAMGIPLLSLMENAGHSVSDEIAKLVEPCSVSIFCGRGGNGGDGFVAARHLINQGFEVEISFLGNPCQIKSKEALINWNVLQKYDDERSELQINIISDSTEIFTPKSEVVVDALLGTGGLGKLREPFATAVDVINQCKALKIAIDIPSGLDPLKGKVVDRAVKADHTITFHKQKSGLNIAEKEYIGIVKVCDIGIPLDAELFTGPGDLLRLKNRHEDSHKGQNGKILIIGGSQEYSGAPALAGMAALYSGVDLSIIACPGAVASDIRSYSPDLIVRSLSNNMILPADVENLIELSKKVDAIVLGCGIGRSDGTKMAVNQILTNNNKPILLDADALKLADKEILDNKDLEIVLTPHSTEFESYFGINVPKDIEGKIDLIRSFNSNSTILLKGKTDIIGFKNLIKLNKTGNPGMTVGGTGDCLAGLVGGLIAQRCSGYEAGFLGAYINGLAGDIAANRYGNNFTASDVLKCIPSAFKINMK